MKPLACASAGLAILALSNGGAWAQAAPPGSASPTEKPAEPPAPTAPPDGPATRQPPADQPPADQPPPAPVDQPPPAPAGPPAASPGGQPPYPAAPPPGYYPYPPYYPYPVSRRPPSPPRTIPYEEGVAAPPGYQLRERTRRGLVIAGAVTLGSTWLLSAVTAGIVESNESNEEFVPLFVPLVGPFITLGTADPNTLGSFVLVADGLAQVVSLGMLVGGIIHPTHEWVLPYAHLELAPLVSADTVGLGAKGSF